MGDKRQKARYRQQANSLLKIYKEEKVKDRNNKTKINVVGQNSGEGNLSTQKGKQ